MKIAFVGACYLALILLCDHILCKFYACPCALILYHISDRNILFIRPAAVYDTFCIKIVHFLVIFYVTLYQLPPSLITQLLFPSYYFIP